MSIASPGPGTADGFSDPFDQLYRRDGGGYGEKGADLLTSYLTQCGRGGNAIDLGAGNGRDSLELLRRGFNVTAVDRSPAGLERLKRTAREAADESDDALGQLDTQCVDVRNWIWNGLKYDVLVATTVADHLSAPDGRRLIAGMARSVSPEGVIYVEVHTVEDPASGVPPGVDRDVPISETAAEIKHYFRSGELLEWITAHTSALRVLHYEERREWDLTHGRPHGHGKAVVLATRADHYPEWYGRNRDFPMPQ